MLLNLKSERLEIRTLTPIDATPKYLSWFENKEIKAHIYAAKNEQTIDSIKAYIVKNLESNNSLLLGLFIKGDGHIGNIKYDSINKVTGAAEMGVMIGDENWRGKGITPEAILAVNNYLNRSHNITKIILGVEKGNYSALKTYERMGFRVVSDHGDSFEMILVIDQSF